LEYEALTGSDKAAIVILSMPPNIAQEFLQGLDDREVEKALAAVARIDEIPPRVQERVLLEFRDSLGKSEEAVAGGRKRAMELLSESMDADRAQKILEGLGRDQKRIDWTLRAFQPSFIAEALADEHPQSIALMLSQLSAERAADIVRDLTEELRAEVVFRLANLDSVTTEILGDLELGVAELFTRLPVNSTRVGGANVAADVLKRVPKDDSATILEGVDERDSEAAGEIRKRLVKFDDLTNIDRRGLQVLLREISSEDLAVALKTAADEMRDKVFENLSSRAVDQIKEEMDLLGPMKLSDVEQVQEQIVEVARGLEAEGRLTIDLGGGDELMV
jgi:flagellar motor switch protein FliG